MISISRLEGFKDFADVVRLIALIKPKEGEPLKIDPLLLSQLQMHLIRVIDLIESIYKIFGPDASNLIAGLIQVKQSMMAEIAHKTAFGVKVPQVSQQQNPSFQSKESTIKEERSDP